jgi:outer membrane immunogenic protein
MSGYSCWVFKIYSEVGLMLRRFIVLGTAMVICLCAAIIAQAADWTGVYVGENSGVAIGTTNVKTSTVSSPTGYFATTSPPAIAAAGDQNPSLSNIIGGILAGFNYQTGVFVVGAEADFGAMPLSVTQTNTAVYPCCAPTRFTINQTVKTQWVATARPRVGFATGDILIYGTGGAAFTNINYQELFTDTFAVAHETGAKEAAMAGYTFGGGMELKFLSNGSLGVQYLYADFGRLSTTSNNLRAYAPPIAFTANTFTHSANLITHLLRVVFNIQI